MAKIGRIINLKTENFVIGNTTIPPSSSAVVFGNRTVVADFDAYDIFTTELSATEPQIDVRTLLSNTLLTLGEVQQYISNTHAQWGRYRLNDPDNSSFYWKRMMGEQLIQGMVKQFDVFDFEGVGVTQSEEYVKAQMGPVLQYLEAGRISWASAYIENVTPGDPADFLSVSFLAFVQTILTSVDSE